MKTRPFRCAMLATRLICVSVFLSASSLQAAEISGYTGAELYKRFCVSCHGKGGEGDGPVAPFFKLQPPDLTGISRRSGGSFPAERVRRILDGRDNPSPHGAREMPVWGLQFASVEGDMATREAAARSTIERLVEYLRSIQKPPRQ